MKAVTGVNPVTSVGLAPDPWSGAPRRPKFDGSTQ
jgi:hypothetical protein